MDIGSDGDFSSRASTPGDCFSQRGRLANGASCTVNVVFSPSVLGKRSGTFTFSASAGGGSRVELSGSGVAGTLSFLAGTPSGVGSADGTGASARFTGPVGLALDGAGNVFVTDTENHTVRKVTPAGVVTTLAGNAGFFGSTDGPGDVARFSYVSGIAVGKSGNVYVSDGSNCTIRKISPDGMVSTLAGAVRESGSLDGTGADARLIGPGAMVVDASDTLFIVDGSTLIRKVSPTGEVTTLAGSPGKAGSVDGTGSTALLNVVMGMTMDGAGNLLLAEKDGAIRKVTPAGVVTTVTRSVGTEVRGLAMDGAGNFYTADFIDTLIRKVTPAGVVSLWAGSYRSPRGADGTGTAARFAGPSNMAVDGAGNFFLTDSGTIRKITPAGVVTTVAGILGSSGDQDGTGAEASFYHPTDVAVDRAGIVIVSQDQFIRKITPAGVVTTFAGARHALEYRDGNAADARFMLAAGMDFDRAGNMVIVDRAGYSVRMVTPEGVVTTLAGQSSVSGSKDGVGSSATFKWPADVAVDGEGNIFMTDSEGHTIRKITPAGVVTTLAGNPDVAGSVDGVGSYARFRWPEGIGIDGLGNLVVADPGDYTVRKITPEGVVTTLAGGAGLSGGADGQGAAARFAAPVDVAMDSAGNAYVSDLENNAVRRITPEGVVTTVVGVLSPLTLGELPGPLPASLVRPVSVALTPAGHLIITGATGVMIVSW